MPSGLNNIQAFDFRKLPHVSRHDARLVNTLYRYLPPTSFAEGLHHSLEALLSKELGPEFSFQLEQVTTTEALDYLQKLPQVGVFLVIGLPPLESAAFCDIDLLFAHSVIDYLLGGEGEPLTMLRPLTEMEQGVFSYLILKVLSHFYEQCGRSARVHFRLQDFCSEPESLRRFVSAETRMIVLNLRATLGQRAGSFRLLFPAAFVQSVFMEPLVDLTAAEAQLYQRRLAELEFVQSELWAEVGRATLKKSELEGVTAGDVILLDPAGVGFRDGRLEGSLTLRVGLGRHCAYRAKLLPSGGRTKVELESSFRPVGR